MWTSQRDDLVGRAGLSSSKGQPRRRQFHPLSVRSVQPLCDDAVAISFEIPPALVETFAFVPGQSVTLRRTIDGREERRSYSICAPVGDLVRVGIREVPGGVFSSWLVHQVHPGEVLEVQAPAGSFTPDLAAGGRHVLIAAGSGITPVLSIAASLLIDSDAQVTLFYGNRRTTSVMFAEELSDLKDRFGPRLELVHVLSREPRDVELFTGRLDAERVRLLLHLLVPVGDVDHFWLCGPLGMVDDAIRVLRELGVPEGRMHRELFYVEDVAPETRTNGPESDRDPNAGEPTSAVTIILDGRSTTLPLRRDVPVLDSAQVSRSDLPFACKGGVCGTCRARVTSGTVDMRRNYALEVSEVEAGFVLTCQSLPTSDEVTVDYDA
ncbi:1,2-phenylacetyl-CoA epoxidase subunit PaaE [Jatrophihabitans sp. DSM 45814]